MDVWKVGDLAKTTFNSFTYVVCHTDNFGNVWFSEIMGKKKRGKAMRFILDNMIKVNSQ
jgi:hypothetical protein